MQSPDFTALLGPELAEAIVKKGYTTLTPVQEAVLDPGLADRDLRISSQTGSGKTLAIGFVLRDVVQQASKPAKGVGRPAALVVTPTRELAKQVEAELTWLYAGRQVRVTGVTGGASYRDEQRALAAGPSIVVGTPGRLLDHLRRGSVDPSGLAAVVLDEADRMLDLGFREDLEAILAMAPAEHRTHLVSATFAREVRALADRVQKKAVNVEGTPLGTANTDIDHVIYMVAPSERVNALINILLANPEDQTLVFARTRADVARIADELKDAGFSVSSLSGEMEQAARNRAMSAFKRGDIQALVATDVAARGIDVQDIARVVQVDPPTDADTYTHRSGRTGRAGRKGTSAILVAPSALSRVSQLLRRAAVKFRTESVPTAASIREKREQRLFAELTSAEEGAKEPDQRSAALARRIVEAGEAERALARLLAQAQGPGRGEPREVSPAAARGERKERPSASSFERGAPPRGRGASPQGGGDWVPFRISWGEAHGADARRLVAMLCRRGGIRGADLGSIRVGPTSSVVDVAAGVAADFEAATRDPDPRDPRVSVQREGASARRPSAEAQRPPRSAGREGPDARREAPVPRHEAPAPRHEAPAPRREAPAPRREAPAAAHEGARMRRDAASETGETAPARGAFAARGPSPKRDHAAARREGPPPSREPAGVRGPSPKRDHAPRRREGFSATREHAPVRRDVANSRREAPVQRDAGPARGEPAARPPRAGRVVSFPPRTRPSSADAPPQRKPRRS